MNRVDQLELNSGCCCYCERRIHPIYLSCLLPHYDVELAVVLVTENEPNVANVTCGVDKEIAFKVNTFEIVLTDG